MTEANMDTNASTTVLQATGLHRTYRMGRVEVPVLRGVDLQVQEGEWLCVLGSSCISTLAAAGSLVLCQDLLRETTVGRRALALGTFIIGRATPEA